MPKAIIPMDCVIFGGGVAGLFTLHSCIASGMHTLLLESNSLGSGQTIESQGIIHGGLKYAITGGGSPSATAIRDMPLVWRRCLAGESEPNLNNVSMRSEYCHIWRTESLRSKLGWLAAKHALRIKPQLLEDYEVPEVLKHVHGTVARLDEQVIEPRSLLEVLSHDLDEYVLQTVDGGVEISKLEDGWLVQILNPKTGAPLDLFTPKLVLTAGKGNHKLRDTLGLTPNKTQERPLHMLMLRGSNLPAINGHCIDGSKTRVTITSTQDYAERTVWQVGGQLSEEGVHKTPEELMQFALKEIVEVLPNLNLDQIEYLTYKSTRAECTNNGSRPTDISILEEDNVLTCWPTKLAFAPRLANEIVSRLSHQTTDSTKEQPTFSDWPTPQVALTPWETDQQWAPIQIPCKQ